MATRPHFPRAEAPYQAARARWVRQLSRALVMLLVAELLALTLAAPAGATGLAERPRPRPSGNSEQWRTATGHHRACVATKQRRTHKAERTHAAAVRTKKAAGKRRQHAEAAEKLAARAEKTAAKAKKAIKDAVGPRSLKLRKRAAKAAARAAKQAASASRKARQKATATAREARELAALAKTLRAKARHTSCPKPVYAPRDFTVFNYPASPNVRRKTAVRYSVLSAIEQSPKGSRIRIAAFTFVDRRIARALLAADARGVGVQVLVNRRLISASPPFRALRRGLGGINDKRGKHDPVSWVRTCRASCLGSGGQLHSKMYLFSRVGRTRWVSMLSSANLTMFAVTNQWNSLDTVTGRKTFRAMTALFRQMTPDRPVKRLQRTVRTDKLKAYLFPQRYRERTDPIRRMLKKISCEAPEGYGAGKVVTTKVKVKGKKKKRTVSKVRRRTIIRISMYTWFHHRGLPLAELVRKKWNQGCNIRVVFGGMARSVFRVLRDPRGRGPIPLQQLVRRDRWGHVNSYDHHKYVLINGSYDGAGRYVVWTGSMNLTERGYRNDELLLRFVGRTKYRAYAADFVRIWRSRLSRPGVEGRLKIDIER